MSLVSTVFKSTEEPTQLSQKYWYLESVLKLEEEINRNISLISQVDGNDDDDDIRMAIGMEISKVKMLKKGKLKMFRDLCLAALKEIPPIEGDKEVTLDDLEGFWCLLAIEAEKHRQSITRILEPKTNKDKTDNVMIGDVIDKAAPMDSIKENKQLNKENKANNKKNIDDRNRKYMERMKLLKERRAVKCIPHGPG